MGILKDTYIVNETKVDLAPLTRKIEKFTNTMEENNRKEINARNRVDISLDEYETMKEKIKELDNELNDYRKFVAELGRKINMDPKILLDSKILDVEVQRNPMNFNNIIRIIFEVDKKYELI